MHAEPGSSEHRLPLSPNRRDYAYILSFYAFAIWIGVGADEIGYRLRVKGYRWMWLLLLAPLMMAWGNWSDHDRHNCHSVHDIALNHLQSCDQGAILITLGDNDTFPLWYLQQVERQRTDIDIYNVNLTGYAKTMQLIEDNMGKRPIYFSQYFVDRFGKYYEGRLRCEGFCWRLLSIGEDPADPQPLLRHINDSTQWHITDNEYIDNISSRFLTTYQNNLGAFATDLSSGR